MASYEYHIPTPVREEIERQISQMRCTNPALMEPYQFSSVTERGKSGYLFTNVFVIGWTEFGFWLGTFRVDNHLVRSGSPQTAETEASAKGLCSAPKFAWRNWDRNQKAPWRHFVNPARQATA